MNFLRRGGEYIFPIRLYKRLEFRGGSERVENLSVDFRAFLDSCYEHHYSPGGYFLGYIYALLHAPTYRSRYAEFLRIDFPRVPFPDRDLPRRGLAAYHGKGDHAVEAVRYGPAEQAVSINKTQFFKPVPQDVWNFHIGGYQVLDKYLKSRKGRKLSLDEINHVGAIAESLAFTIQQMARIDEAYRVAFESRGYVARSAAASVRAQACRRQASPMPSLASPAPASPDQADIFGGAPQPDLFGVPAPKA